MSHMSNKSGFEKLIELVKSEMKDTNGKIAVVNQSIPLNIENYVKSHKEELRGPKGDQGVQGPQGAAGAKGSTGDAGVSVSKVTQTTTSTADGGENIITVELTNG